jgi:hypothetical protein
MSRIARLLTSFAAAIVFVAASIVPALAVESDVRVLVPDVPGGVIVSNCYRAAVRIYDGFRFDFCLKQRGTYTASKVGVRCEGRLTWGVDGIWVNAKLRRTSCGGGKAWSADSLSCRPSILLSFLGNLIGDDRPLLDRLICDYTPAKGTGEKKITFVANRR